MILPGVHIVNGVIIGENSVVGSHVDDYTIVAGNPAKVLRERFDNEMIERLLRFQWWDKSVDKIDRLIPTPTCGDLEQVKSELKNRLNG